MQSKLQQLNPYALSNQYRHYRFLRALAFAVSAAAVLGLTIPFGFAGDVKSNVVLALALLTCFWMTRAAILQGNVLSKKQADVLIGLASVALVTDD